MRVASAFYLVLVPCFGTTGLARRPVARNLTVPPGDDLTVETPGGIIHGTINSSTPLVRRFLDIPYARPPLSQLRFAPPEPAKPFGELDATHFGPSCMQTLLKISPNIYTQYVTQFNPQGSNETSTNLSEDCLTLSVWAPASRNATAGPLPVIVFIFGGAFARGGEDVPYQIPAKWVQRTQSHVMVTFNYRLNIFGFPNAAGIPADKQNLGLLDQRLAVKWVRDNIAAFGGDPKRIALWGQSAGGVSAGQYQYAYAADPIVDAIMMDSGTEQLLSALMSTTDTNHSNFTTVATQFGCGGLGPKEELECMRGDNVSAKAVEEFIQSYNAKLHPPLLTFTPVLDNVTTFANFVGRPVAKVPTIIGTTTNDGAAFVPLGPNGVNQTLADAATLLWFYCPAVFSTARLAAGVPVFRYLYAGNFSNISPAPFLGAYHASELPLLFGTDAEFRGPSTPLERATEIAMEDAWLAIARGGARAVEATGWPRCTTKSGPVEKFGAANTKDGSPAQIINTAAKDVVCPAVMQNQQV